MGCAQQHILAVTTLQQRMLQMYVVKTKKKVAAILEPIHNLNAYKPQCGLHF